MRAVIQRVSQSSVVIEGSCCGEIGPGLNILIGIENGDADEDDDSGVMNLSVRDVDGDILVISQFTLYASTRKGNRPSYIKAARPEISIPLYEKFLQRLENILGKPVKKGIFGANMRVTIVNEGPVTILIDTKNRE